VSRTAADGCGAACRALAVAIDVAGDLEAAAALEALDGGLVSGPQTPSIGPA